jgi:ATP-dependent DNA ligase
MNEELETRLSSLKEEAGVINDFVRKVQVDLKHTGTVNVERVSSGLRVLVSKDNGRVLLKVSDGKDVSSLFPTIVSQLSKISDKDFVVDAQIVFYDSKGKVVSNDEVVAFLSSGCKGKEILERDVTCFFSDLLFFNGESVVGLPWCDRMRMVKGFGFGEQIRLNPMMLAKSEVELGKVVDLFGGVPGTVGVLLKRYVSKYEPGVGGKGCFYLSLKV